MNSLIKVYSDRNLVNIDNMNELLSSSLTDDFKSTLTLETILSNGIKTNNVDKLIFIRYQI